MAVLPTTAGPTRRPVTLSLLLFLILLALALATTPLAAPQVQKPLKEAEILKELASGTSNRRVAAQVRQSGITFVLSPGSEERLRALGADDELIAAIRAAAAARTAAE